MCRSKSLTFLVVDDNHDVAEVFGLILSYCGMEVIFASTVKECLAICLATEVDGILTDQNLPDGLGGNLPALLGEKFPKVSMLISGYAVNLRSQYPGFNDYLQKPIHMDVLCDTIKKHIQEAA